ncbi:MAG TPA: GerMN domain-containing protein [Symbiobacteriaceae bacterium]|nr:GerMN domain-containing protein [Symbiobacteriaceae bacterium]
MPVKTTPEEIMRGVDSYLECWDGSDWSPRYMLQVGHGSSDAKPMAIIAGDNIRPLLGLGGPGPETLVLPDKIPPGWYRIRKQVHVGTAQQTLTAVFEVKASVLHVFYTPAGDPLPATPRAVPRQVAADSVGPRTALEELLKGPTDQERSAGYFSWFSRQTAGMLNSFTLTADGRAIVDFKDFSAIIPNASTSAGMAQLYRELGHTLAQFPEISEIQYRFDGSCPKFYEWLQSECQVIPAARYRTAP